MFADLRHILMLCHILLPLFRFSCRYRVIFAMIIVLRQRFSPPALLPLSPLRHAVISPRASAFYCEV